MKMESNKRVFKRLIVPGALVLGVLFLILQRFCVTDLICMPWDFLKKENVLVILLSLFGLAMICFFAFAVKSLLGNNK